MADQKRITLQQGDGSPSTIVLRPLPVADTPSGRIYLYPGHVTPSTIVLSDPGVARAGTGPTTFSHTASGGLVLGGVAQVVRTFSLQASGGLVLSGVATVTRTFHHAATGGLVLGGIAGATRTYAATASGGLTFGGSAATARTFAAAATGGLNLSGAAELRRTFVAVASGGLVFGGTAHAARTLVAVATGGLQMAGAATITRAFAVAPTGGLTFGGAADLRRTLVSVASGGLVLSGAATAIFVPAGGTTFSHTATGGLTLAGAAGTVFVPIPPAPSAGGGHSRPVFRRNGPAHRPHPVTIDAWKRRQVFTWVTADGRRLAFGGAAAYRFSPGAAVAPITALDLPVDLLPSQALADLVTSRTAPEPALMADSARPGTMRPALAVVQNMAQDAARGQQADEAEAEDLLLLDLL